MTRLNRHTYALCPSPIASSLIVKSEKIQGNNVHCSRTQETNLQH